MDHKPNDADQQLEAATAQLDNLKRVTPPAAQENEKA